MTIEYPNLYQIDSKGKLRFWKMEVHADGKHRTVSGIVDGKEVTSRWVECEAKNVGRSNATTPFEQAQLEAEADYKLKRDKKYYDSIDEARAAGSGTKFLSPMLAEKWHEQKDKALREDVLYVQPKLDGIRAVITADGITSRAGKPIFGVPHISAALEEFFFMHPKVALDGELYNHELKHDFNKISSLVKKPKPTPEELAESDRLMQFHCYDVIMPGNFEERIRFRDENLDQHWCVKRVLTVTADTFEADVDDFHAWCIGEGYEGSVIRLNRPYESKRSKSLMKRKDFFDMEVELSGFIEGKGNWAGCVKAVKFLMPDGRLTENGELPEAGCRGTMEFLADLLRRTKLGEGPKWATIRYPNLTPAGIPRFAQVTQWHEGKREL